MTAFDRFFKKLLELDGGYWGNQFSDPIERGWFKIGLEAKFND